MTVTGAIDALGIDTSVAAEWIDKLPGCSQVAYIDCSFGRVGQSMVDSIGTMSWLKGLSFGVLAATDLRPLSTLKELEFLSIKQLTSATDLAPLLRLPQLRYLAIGISRKITSLDCFESADLTSLVGLELFGSAESQQPRLNSIKPLAALKSVVSIAVLANWIDDTSLAAFLGHGHLQRLALVGRIDWPEETIASLRNQGVDIVNTKVVRSRKANE